MLEIKGFNMETWKMYRQFILENEDLFKQICERDIVNAPIGTGPEDRKPMFHQNPKLNFNLPMDMGGLGPLFKPERYSRVNFLDKAQPPYMKMKQNYTDCFMPIARTAKPYDTTNPIPIIPEHLRNARSDYIIPNPFSYSAFPPMPPVPPPIGPTGMTPGPIPPLGPIHTNPPDSPKSSSRSESSDRSRHSRNKSRDRSRDRSHEKRRKHHHHSSRHHSRRHEKDDRDHSKHHHRSKERRDSKGKHDRRKN